MKKIYCASILLLIIVLSSCATLFTSSNQPITFVGPEGTKIFDLSTNIKIAEIGSDKTVTVPIKKKLSDKQLVAKKEGYKTVLLMLEGSFNPTSLWNILIPLGFIVDLGTGQIKKWDNTYINIDLEKGQSE